MMWNSRERCRMIPMGQDSTRLYKTLQDSHGYESKYKVWIKAPNPHTIHTPRSIPWSIPCGTAWSIPLIHTPDPYPFLIEERLMLALMLLFILILLLVLVLLLPLLLPLLLVATPVATTVATIVATAASAASAASVLLLLLLLLPLLVIFLPGAAAAAVASAGPALAAGAGSLPPCASGSWTNATSWVAITSNIASAPWRLVRPVLVPLGASCTSSGAMTTTPSVSALSASVELD